MVEQEVEIVVVAVDLHSPLPGNEAEAHPEFEDERLDLSQDRRLQILLRVSVLQPQKVQQVRVAEYQIRR